MPSIAKICAGCDRPFVDYSVGFTTTECGDCAQQTKEKVEPVKPVAAQKTVIKKPKKKEESDE